MTDWRTGAGYPDPKRTSQAQWAWEFLRRNPQYRADWRDYVERCESLREKYGAEAIGDDDPTEVAWSRYNDVDATGHDPARLTGETEDPWLERVGKGSRAPLSLWLCRKWGMRGFPQDPAKQPFRGWWSSSKTIVREVVSREYQPTTPRSLRCYEFDLTRPLEPQLSAVKSDLLVIQKSLIERGLIDKHAAHGRAQSGVLYQRALRVLDALEAMGYARDTPARAPALRAIGAALFPKDENPQPPERPRDKKVSAIIGAARRLRDGGYRLLPSLAARKR